MNFKYFVSLLFAGSFACSLSTAASELVSAETINLQKSLTKETKLANGIPVIYRRVDKSDIFEILISFRSGVKDLPTGKKSHISALMAAMPMGGKGFPKQVVYKMSEKYALELGCSAAIETSSCILGTVNDYWREVLPLYAAIINAPLLTKQDVDLVRERLKVDARNIIKEPGRYANDVVNRVFYPEGHPYRQSAEESLRDYDAMKDQDLRTLHKQIHSAKNMVITIAASVPLEKILPDLNRHFGKIPTTDVPHVTPTAPAFDSGKSFAFEGRDIPTAYINIKFNGIGVTEKDAEAAEFMLKILDEELGEEIRTRRSLSYSVYSYMLQYSVGIGVIGASTSKPQETLEAITAVVKKLQSKPLSDENLKEHKRVYVTQYFRGKETHSSLVSSLAGSYMYFGNAYRGYEYPSRIDAVTANDVKRLAEQLLVNFRVGIVYGRDRFKDAWAKTLIDKSLKK